MEYISLYLDSQIHRSERNGVEIKITQIMCCLYEIQRGHSSKPILTGHELPEIFLPMRNVCI